MVQSIPSAARKLVRALGRRKEREEQRSYLAEGDRLLGELAVCDPEGIRFLFGRRDRVEWLGELFPNGRIYSLDDDGTDLFATENPQGVGAVVAMPASFGIDAMASSGRPLLYLEGIADPGNAGTIIRSAGWFGAGGVIFGEGSVDPYNPKTVRSTMGAIFKVPIAADISVDVAAATGLQLFALDAAGSLRLGAATLPTHAIYIIGSEAHGVSGATLARATSIAIEGDGSGESLNASIAASVLLYELGRSG